MNNNNLFSQYVKYIPNENLKPFSNFILVFDFDLTITAKHTEGTPRVHPMDARNGRGYIDYINNYFSEDFKYLKDFLKEYSKYYNIYI